MSKSIILSFFLLVNLVAQSQSPAEAPYKQFPTVPPFKLLLTDSLTQYGKEDLPKRKATLIMLFSPECDHCRHQTDSILANIKSFKNIQIVMASVLPFDYIRRFYAEYKLDQYPNIVVGRDSQFLLPGFFQSHSLPVLGLYDKKKNLIEVMEGTIPVATLLSKFSK
jgi:thioredoxin-related protein